MIRLLIKWVQFINKYQKSTLGGQMKKQFVLQSCFYILPRHTNVMTNKGFSLFDEWSFRCVHLSPQEEEWTSSFLGKSKCTHWEHSKFTEDANWNKRKWRYNLDKDLSGKWYCQILKAFRIISSEIQIWFLILS